VKCRLISALTGDVLCGTEVHTGVLGQWRLAAVFRSAHSGFRCAPDVNHWRGSVVTERGKFKSSHRSYYSMRPPEVPLDMSSKEVVGTRLKKLHASLLSGGHQTCAPDGEQCQQLV